MGQKSLFQQLRSALFKSPGQILSVCKGVTLIYLITLLSLLLNLLLLLFCRLKA